MATSRIASMARFAMSLPEGPTRADIIRIVVAMAMAKDAGAALDKHAAEQFLAGLMKQKQEKVQSGIRRDAAPYDNALREHGFDSDDPMTELMRGRLWDKVMRSAQGVVGGMRGIGDEIQSQAGIKGVTGDDFAQVYGFGGTMEPGMIFDNRSKTFKDRKNPKFPKGQSIYYKAGEMFRKNKWTGGLSQLQAWLVQKTKNYVKNWLQGVDAFRNVAFEKDEHGQLLQDYKGYEDVNPVELLSQQIHLNRIYDVMKRELSSAPGQLVVWNAVVDATNKGKDVLKFKSKGEGKGDLTVQAAALRKHVLEMLEKSVGPLDAIDPRTDKPYKDSVPSPQALQKNFTKILPKMIDAMERELSDGDLGSMGAAMKRDLDIAEVYEDSIRRRAAKNVTASERSAMIRLAAALPVGSPERRAILAGCEKLPAGPMRDNCEKSKEDGVQPGKGKAKSDDKKKDDGKMPAELLEKFKAKKKAASGPHPKGRNWKDKGGRWVWAGSDGDPAFTVVEKSAPFGSYYKLQMLLPDGGMYAAANQKSEKEDLFKRAAELYKAWGSAAGFDLSRQPERWSKMAGKGKLPDALKEHQFTGKDGDNPPPADADGDGKTNEKKPDFLKDKKAALVRLAAALPVGSDERKIILRMAAKKQASQRTHHSKGIEQLSDNDLRKLFNDLLKFDKMMAKWNRSGPAWGGPHPDDWAAFHAEAKMRGIKL